jgi:hypothetical protein
MSVGPGEIISRLVSSLDLARRAFRPFGSVEPLLAEYEVDQQDKCLSPIDEMFGLT